MVYYPERVLVQTDWYPVSFDQVSYVNAAQELIKFFIMRL